MNKTVTRRFHRIQLHPSLVLISNTPRRIGYSAEGSKFGPIMCLNEDRKPEVPLCIILGWFAAKKRHLMKFGDFYLDNEFDVLMISSPPSTFVDPIGSVKHRAKLLLKFYQHSKDSYASIFVHGFSVGALIWGTFLRRVKCEVGEHEILQQKIRGQLWDSLFIDADRMSEVGSSVVCQNNKVVQKLFKAYATAVISVLDSREASEAFENLNFNTPYLLICSEEDPISLSTRVAGCAQIWKEKGATVYWKAWENTSHVAHMKQNPKEYRALWEQFLEKIGLLTHRAKLTLITAVQTKL